MAAETFTDTTPAGPELTPADPATPGGDPAQAQQRKTPYLITVREGGFRGREVSFVIYGT